MAGVRLVLAAAFPAAASALLYLLDRRKAPGRPGGAGRQAVYGLVFGALAVLGSEFGVPIQGGAIINARDASPLCAGLIFGPGAGIIAGLIGGAERWLAVHWGAGTYTRVACSLSTCLAGFFAAALRKWMFDGKKPSWSHGLAAGLVMEVFHMLMLFFTNMDDVHKAFTFVQLCSAPMILTNALSVMAATLLVSRIGKEGKGAGRGPRELTQTFSRWLMAVVLVAFAFTGIFTWFLQTSFADNASETLLRLNIDDIKADVREASDANLLRLARTAASSIDAAQEPDAALLERLMELPGNDFSEINVVDRNGIITATTTPAFLGFDMASGEQSGAFMALLEGRAELVQGYQRISHENAAYMKYAGVALRRGGFVQVGYDAERFRKDVDAQMAGATRNRHVGETGFIIVHGGDGAIVSGPEGLEGRTLEEAGVGALPDVPEGARFRMDIAGRPCYCVRAEEEGYGILAAQPVEEVLFSRNLAVYLNIFIEVLVFALLFILVYLLIKKLVVSNIHQINSDLRQITGGNLDVSVDVKSNEEFASLSNDINSTVATLKDYIAEAASRIDKELEVARVIQSSTLPTAFPPFPGRPDIALYATMDTAKEVGGDFYDFYFLDENRLAFLIADVSGKGITAAMFMMKAKTLIKDHAEKEDEVQDILSKANEDLCEGNDAGMFVTCWMGILDLRTGIVSFANAGHNPPLVRRGGGGFEYFRSRPGFVLGGMEGIRYKKGSLELRPGDEIFIYTDGVTEATNKADELFGDARLLEAANALRGAAPKEFCLGVKSAVDSFVGDAPQFDDMTMLTLRLLPRDAITLAPVQESMEQAQSFVEERLEKAGVPAQTATKMLIAVDEIFSNIIRYSGARTARIECGTTEGWATLTFSDDGRPYDPTQQAEPDTSLSAEERGIGGLGLLMVRKFMDTISYEHKDGWNILRLGKRTD